MDKVWLEEEMLREWESVLDIREMVLKALEIERSKKTMGNSLEAKVILKYPESYEKLIEKFKDFLPSIFIVSQVETIAGNELEVNVLKADGEKCQRCWNYSLSVGKDKDFPDLCPRCVEVIKKLQ